MLETTSYGLDLLHFEFLTLKMKESAVFPHFLLISCKGPKSATASILQCAHSAPDFTQIGSLSLEL